MPRSTLEFVDSIPALAAAAAAIGERRHGTSRGVGAVRSRRCSFACYEPALSQLMAALTPIVIESARSGSPGELSFDDLLVLTRRLLQTQPDVRNEIRARHRHLFVDEFQDTDQVQFDVISELTAPDAASPPSSLFAVGDPKQSIYGFRNADVELFSSLLAADGSRERAHHQPPHAGRRVRVDQRGARRNDSRRSTSRTTPEHQVPYTPLEPQRSANAVGRRPRGRRAGHARLDRRSSTRPPKTRHAPRPPTSPRSCSRSCGPGPWMVTDASRAPVDRPASYRDITVLIRSRTRLGVLEHTLRQAGVPYRVEGGTLIYGSREVYELLRVLRAIDDPTNQLKVVTALRTSIFGIDDRQLMHYRLGPPDRRQRRISTGLPCLHQGARRRRRRAADDRAVRSPQARAHPGRAARRALRRLARGRRGAVRRPAGGPGDMAARALRHRRGPGVERRHRRNAGRVPGLGRPAHRRRRSGRAQHRRGRGLAADHDHPRRKGSRVPDHDRCRSRRCRRHRTRRPGCTGRAAGHWSVSAR